MPYPAKYASTVSIPLPSDEAVRKVIGDSYNPEKALNVIKMFAGADRQESKSWKGQVDNLNPASQR